jgi:hypothetical protein
MARRQLRHRQSSKPVALTLPGEGSGSLTASSPHQHGPPKVQENVAPQRAQARLREVPCDGLGSFNVRSSR